MLVEKFKEVCDSLGWEFHYGARHWQNLLDYADDEDLDFEDKNKYMLLHYADREVHFNVYGGVLNTSYEGEFVFGVRSRVSDVDYSFKYENHIKPLRDILDGFIKGFQTCDNWGIESWVESEVENVINTNIDGIYVRFKMKYIGE